MSPSGDQLQTFCRTEIRNNIVKYSYEDTQLTLILEKLSTTGEN